MMVLLLQNLFLLSKTDKTYGATPEEFGTSKIIGTPKVSCDSKWLTVDVKTSVPFQGRIYVDGKAFDKRCAAQFLMNSLPNATVQIPIMDCANIREVQPKKLTEEGTKKYRIWVDIRVDFHPIFITSVSHVFRAECNGVDIADYEKSVNVICSHEIISLGNRSHSKLDKPAKNIETLEFKVGQKIEHHWKCTKQRKYSKVQIHAKELLRNVQDKGNTPTHRSNRLRCTVDEELLSNLTAVDNMESIVDVGHAPESERQIVFRAESTTFKFPDENEMRFQCSLFMVPQLSNSGPIEFPKCTITREDIMERSRRNFSDPYRYILPSKAFRDVVETLTVTRWIRVKEEFLLSGSKSSISTSKNEILKESEITEALLDDMIEANDIQGNTEQKQDDLLQSERKKSAKSRKPVCEMVNGELVTKSSTEKAHTLNGDCSWRTLSSAILLWSIGSTALWLVIVARKLFRCAKHTYSVGPKSTNDTTPSAEYGNPRDYCRAPDTLQNLTRIRPMGNMQLVTRTDVGLVLPRRQNRKMLSPSLPPWFLNGFTSRTAFGRLLSSDSSGVAD
ncbi:cuticlin-1 [Ditylenchus destructor]|nr:cuticlin-1 [Ditylenchus destructor]